jgi:hypothetical protein
VSAIGYCPSCAFIISWIWRLTASRPTFFVGVRKQHDGMPFSMTVLFFRWNNVDNSPYYSVRQPQGALLLKLEWPLYDGGSWQVRVH